MKNKEAGFSLIELLVALTIASILLSYGIPNLRELVIRQSISTKANDILVDLTYARYEAINGGTPVSIIPNTKWENGWQIVTDNNGDGIMEILRISNAIEKDIVLSDENIELPIVFNPTGSLGASENRIILIKHDSIDQFKTLKIALNGNSSIY